MEQLTNLHVGSFAILALTGLPRTGKDTAAEFLVNGFGFERIAFADALRDTCAALTNRPIEEFYEDERKEERVPGFDFTYREALRKVGTEVVRDSAFLGPDWWLRVAERKMLEALGEGQTRFVITDVRFPNEAAWLRGLKAHFVHLQRPGCVGSDHRSDAGVEQRPQDDVVANSGSKEALFATLARIVAEKVPPL